MEKSSGSYEYEEQIVATGVIMKLLHIDSLMPEREEFIYNFGKFLAEYAGNHDKLTPMGFYTMAISALYDLSEQTASVKKYKFGPNLLGYPKIVFNALAGSLPDMAKSLFGEDFGIEVESIAQQMKSTTS